MNLPRLNRAVRGRRVSPREDTHADCCSPAHRDSRRTGRCGSGGTRVGSHPRPGRSSPRRPECSHRRTIRSRWHDRPHCARRGQSPRRVDDLGLPHREQAWRERQCRCGGRGSRRAGRQDLAAWSCRHSRHESVPAQVCSLRLRGKLLAHSLGRRGGKRACRASLVPLPIICPVPPQLPLRHQLRVASNRQRWPLGDGVVAEPGRLPA